MIWLLPALLVVVESFIFLPKALRNSDFLIYYIVFWIMRAALAPLIAYYTFRFWIEYNKYIRLFLVHLLGFFLFSVIFWFTSYFILHDILFESVYFDAVKTKTNVGIFSIIADNSLSTNIIVYASTVAFCYAWEFFRRNAEANKKAAELEKSLLVSRLELLKGQLNTHFLFNTLHTISSLVVRSKTEEANQMLVKLSDLLRFALKENKEQLIPLEKEMEILQLYIDIQQARFNERFNVRLNYPDALRNALVPPLILQPLVENAVKYAIEPYSQKGTIQIDIEKKNSNLFISISDNGPKPFQSIDFDNGIGLQNTRERLKQLFGERQHFQVKPNQNQGTAVSFDIPFLTSTNGTIKDPDR